MLVVQGDVEGTRLASPSVCFQQYCRPGGQALQEALGCGGGIPVLGCPDPLVLDHISARVPH